MSMPVVGHGLQKSWEPPIPAQIDEALWQAWVIKGRIQEKRRRFTAIRAANWISVVVLLSAATDLWSHVGSYDIAVRFIVGACSAAAMIQAIHNKRYTFAVVFGALALLYNPVAPAFIFSGGWQRTTLGMSTIPFAASLRWRDVTRGAASSIAAPSSLCSDSERNGSTRDPVAYGHRTNETHKS